FLKDEADLRTAARQQRRRAVEQHTMRDEAAVLARHDRAAQAVALEQRRHQAAALGELLEQRRRQLGYRALDDDRLVGRLRGMATGYLGGDHHDVVGIELAQRLLRPLRQGAVR